MMQINGLDSCEYCGVEKAVHLFDVDSGKAKPYQRSVTEAEENEIAACDTCYQIRQ